MSKVKIIDYGICNILSVIRAFEFCGAQAEVISSPDDIEGASLLVLPGVGAFRDGIAALKEKDLINAIKKYCITGKPFMGICLGMQMMLNESEEFGRYEGMGIIHGRVIRIKDTDNMGSQIKIPHISWNSLNKPENSNDSIWDDTILRNIKSADEVYFVHSYMAVPKNENDRLADTYYEGQRICAGINKENIYGLQFHPEKSGEVGLNIIREFIKLN